MNGVQRSEAAGVVASPRVQAFERSRRWVRQVHAFCDAVQQGIWLGVLDADGLQHLTDYHYRATQSGDPSDKNYFSETHNASGFFGWEQAVFDAHFAECRTMLVGAAGGGRETLELSRRGVKVDAFECNADLAESCRSFLAAHGVAARVVAASPNEVPESLDTYDGAILGWSSYMHIVGRDRRISFLKGFRRHLRLGAPVLLSFVRYGDSRPRRLTYRVGSIIRRMRFARPIERGDSLSTTFDHLFTKEEIRQEMAAAGFELVAFSERRHGYAVGKAVPVEADNPCHR
jgi:hypothetical protein